MNRKQRAMEERHLKRDKQFTKPPAKPLTKQEVMFIKIKDFVAERKQWNSGTFTLGGGTWATFNYTSGLVSVVFHDNEESEVCQLYKAVWAKQDWDTLQLDMMREWKVRQTKLYKVLK